jgi:ectoine hydroxylase-related dioxygenase (phytanoyl-CoA dioxygenase family)
MELAENTQGVSKRKINLNLLDLKQEEFKRQGYTLIESGLSSYEIEKIKKKLAVIHQIQIEEVAGKANLDLIGDYNLIRSPISYDGFFKEIALNHELLSFAKHVLGKNISLIFQNGVNNPPAAQETIKESAKWHRDLNHQHWVCSECLAINAMLCLDDFNISSGGTCIIPGSHLFEECPSVEYTSEHNITPHVKSGTFIVMNAMTYHKTGINSSFKERRGLNHMLARPILAPHLDLSSCITENDDEFTKGYLGARWSPAPSVKDWRNQRIQLKKNYVNHN